MALRRCSPVALVALFLGAAACHSAPGDLDAGPQVAGTVVEEPGGAPISGAQICILEHPEVGCVQSDSEGSYTLALPTLSSTLDLAVNATAAGHLGFVGLLEEPPASDGGVNWFSTISLRTDAAAALFFADAGLAYPAAGKAFLYVSIVDDTGAALVGETATLNPASGTGPIYLNDAGTPDPSLTALTSDGALLFGDLTPGRVQVTLAGTPCAPIDLGVGAWAAQAAQTVAAETAANSMTTVDVVCP
jgi:hypothetical protein